MRLSQAINGFLLDRSGDGETSQNTINLYRIHLTQLKGRIGDADLAEISQQCLTEFMAYMRMTYVPRRVNGDTSPLSSSSLRNIWCALRSFFQWHSGEFGGDDPSVELKCPKVNYKAIQPFTAEQVKALLKACPKTTISACDRHAAFVMRRPTAMRDVAIIVILLDTGVRVSELCRMRVEDANLETGEVFIAPFGTGRKTKSRHVYLGKASRRALWRYLARREGHEPQDPLILSDENKPFTRNAARLLLTRLGKHAGVSNAHPHRFRHTFAIEYLRNGGDPFTLQRLLGHSTLDMVRRYLDIVRADLANAHKRSSPVDRWSL